mmetsp:Transcript_5667/g.7177  ORF Transcript_5667/g.7177 Transcript_5667/m.7177 type:complete len:203 (-) Transcript_5667:159-767(-)
MEQMVHFMLESSCFSLIDSFGACFISFAGGFGNSVPEPGTTTLFSCSESTFPKDGLSCSFCLMMSSSTSFTSPSQIVSFSFMVNSTPTFSVSSRLSIDSLRLETLRLRPNAPKPARESSLSLSLLSLSLSLFLPSILFTFFMLLSSCKDPLPSVPTFLSAKSLVSWLSVDCSASNSRNIRDSSCNICFLKRFTPSLCFFERS